MVPLSFFALLVVSPNLLSAQQSSDSSTASIAQDSATSSVDASAAGDESESKEKDSEEDEFSKMLNLAEKDVSQLSSVKVSTSAPSMNTEVSTVSRAPSTIGKTPAAVFVITNEMIQRSGATSVPEVLRMAPGVEVARIDSSKWAISIRGFNGQFANKLLVQIDGRTVYSPYFAGVFWDVQDLFLEDVERIEVIRGPGASVWGANAVNGVINVITKNSKETQGLFAQAGTGTYERGFTNLRYGGELGKTGINYRVYGKWFDRGFGSSLDGVTPSQDAWHLGSGGFRADWDVDGTGTDRIMITGDSFNTRSSTIDGGPSPFAPFLTSFGSDFYQYGSHIIGRWTHKIDDDREWQIQTYFDTTSRETPRLNSFEDRDTFDIDTQYRFPLGDYQKIVVGAAYRSSTDQLQSGAIPIGFNPGSQRVNTASAFIQDDITLVEDRWVLTLGSKFFENTYVGFDYQPTARLLFTPDERHSLWGAVSRAVRMPSRVEDSINGYGVPVSTTPVPLYPHFIGNSDLKPEDLLAWELGYRTQATDAFSYDTTAFYNQYDNLVVFNPTGMSFSPYGLALDLQAQNFARAQTYGFEVASNYEISKTWRLRSAYSHLEIFMDNALSAVHAEEGQTPQNQIYFQSSHDLRKSIQLDLIGRYVGALPAYSIPDYFVSDIRFAWKPRKSIECFVVGRGLFDDGHQEFASTLGQGGTATGVRSEVYTGISFRR